jgi:hypothetical protein
MSSSLLIYTVFFVLGLILLAFVPKLYNHLQDNGDHHLNPLKSPSFLTLLGLGFSFIVVGWVGTANSTKHFAQTYSESVLYTKFSQLHASLYREWQIKGVNESYPVYFRIKATEAYPDLKEAILHVRFIPTANKSYMLDPASLQKSRIK